MDTRILVVAPFADLCQVVSEVVEERFSGEQDYIQIIEGDLRDSLAMARQAAAAGAEVIVSRGGTAELLASHVAVPVVNIQVTVLDVIRAIRQQGHYPAKIGVAGFKNVIYGCEDLEGILGISIEEITVETEQEAEIKLAQAAQDGIDMIVGDAISTRLAAKYGMAGVVIQSGKDAVYKAIIEAKALAKVCREEQAKAELLRTLINTSAEGIIAVDIENRVTVLNPMAEKMLQADSSEVLGRTAEEALPLFKMPRLENGLKNDDVQQIGQRMLAVKSTPLKVHGQLIGMLTSLQNVSQLQKLEQMVRKKLHGKGLVAKIELGDMAGISSALQLVKQQAVKYAATQSTILITGESGTGKEMLAQSIHNASRRRREPFVAVNCAALPENLLESELFGYEEGAFTGARKGGRAGLFELAHGGTIFLDEIGEMTMPLQSRLLRVLQEKEVMRLGGDSVIPVDVRIVAATNQDLPLMIQRGDFRQDLYYRLNILRLTMPPLRQRREDIPELVKQLLLKLQPLNPLVTGISPAALALLKRGSWPGNVRQLANTMERAVVLSEVEIIDEAAIAAAYDEEDTTAAASDCLAVQEEETLQRVLAEEGGNYSRAAARLGIHRTTLWRKINNNKKIWD